MPLAVDGMKQCWRCRETKPVSEYYISNTKKDGLRDDCKVCSREVKKKLYHEKVKTEPYVYEVVIKNTGQFYIGKTVKVIEVRINNHKNCDNTGLGKIMRKHNLTFDDLKISQYPCKSTEESTALERKLIAENIDNPLCLNKQRW